MGWGRTLLLGDIGNRMDIADTERDIQHLRSQLRQTHSSQLHRDDAQDTKITQLMHENDQLKLYLASLLRLLVGKGVLSQSELAKFVDLIDGSD